MKALVALGGEILDTPLLRARIAGVKWVIAADSGAEGLQALGIQPHAVTGDFDSLEPAALERLRAQGVEVVPHPNPEYATDAQVALGLAMARGAKEVVLVGVRGGERLDHSLANLVVAAAAEYRQAAITIVSGWTEAALLSGAGRRSVRFRGVVGDYVSLIPLGDEVRGITTAGLKWPLRGASMRLGEYGMSNELMEGEGGFEIEAGVAYATHHCRYGRLA